jgi:hypothetical protein
MVGYILHFASNPLNLFCYIKFMLCKITSLLSICNFFFPVKLAHGLQICERKLSVVKMMMRRLEIFMSLVELGLIMSPLSL